MIRSDLPACRVPCQSPEMSPFAWVSVVGAGVAAGADGDVWALAGVRERVDPKSVAQVSADIACNTDFTVICWSGVLKDLVWQVIVYNDCRRQLQGLLAYVGRAVFASNFANCGCFDQRPMLAQAIEERRVRTTCLTAVLRARGWPASILAARAVWRRIQTRRLDFFPRPI